MAEKTSLGISLIIPTYNEASSLVMSINQCLTSLENDFENFEIIIVNDGSKDNSDEILTAQYSNDNRVKIVHNYINLNQGISIQRAMVVASMDYIIHNGIDLPLNPSEIKQIIDGMQDADILVLERSAYSGATKWRFIISNINILLRKVLFPDLTNGISDMNYTQVYRRNIIKYILPLAKSPAFTTPEMIIRGKFFGLKVSTKYIDYQARKSGKGSLGKIHDILWTIYDMFRFRFLLWMGLKKHGVVK